VRLKEAHANTGRFIQEIIDALETRGRYDFSRFDAGIRITRWSQGGALRAYEDTLRSMKSQIEGEPPSATLTSKVKVEYSAEPAEIGQVIRQTHTALIREEVRDAVDNWIRIGAPYPTSGGFYDTRPNKSFERVKQIMKYPELRDLVRNLGIQDDWIRLFSDYLPLRWSVSRQMLDMVISGHDPEAFSRHNEEAGTGVMARGRRLYRKDIAPVAADLEFLLDYSFAMGAAFAATQVAELIPGHVWMIEVLDHRVRGAIAARSDMEVLDVNWNGEELVITGVAKTRQVGGDGTGVLSNSDTEKKLMRMSVTEATIRKFKDPRVEYPFTNRSLLMDMIAADAKPFEGQPFVIGQDLGLTDPVKAGADTLFCRAFLMIKRKVLPELVSGKGFTPLVYCPIHNYYARKAPPDVRFMDLGDDVNSIGYSIKPSFYDPYQKVKSTNPEQNTKKLLGILSAYSIHPDPDGQAQALVGQVPRGIKTLSSASRRSRHWDEQLNDLPPRGVVELTHMPETEEVIKRDIGLLRPYIMWVGKRSEVKAMLESLWRNPSPEVWDALTRHNEELEHRMDRVERADTAEEDEGE
jgi:hypothetical protein